MFDTWEGGWDSGNPTMETSPIRADWDNGSSFWTLATETVDLLLPFWDEIFHPKKLLGQEQEMLRKIGDEVKRPKAFFLKRETKGVAASWDIFGISYIYIYIYMQYFCSYVNDTN